MTAPSATLLRRFHAELLSSDSATRLLEHWSGAPVWAQRVAGLAAPVPDDHRPWLALAAGEPVAYRRVNLIANGRILCVAENWYVPGRLSPAMNHALTATTTPFGHVVAPLRPRRRTLSARLWPESGPPPTVLEHRTLLTGATGQPLSLVHEAFTDEIVRV